MFGWILNTSLGMKAQTNVILVFALASDTFEIFNKRTSHSPRNARKNRCSKNIRDTVLFFVRVTGLL